jgi:hypothetical protein
MTDAEVIEHSVNERRAHLEEYAFVRANKRGSPSAAGLPHTVASDLTVPLLAQMSPAQQATLNATDQRLSLTSNLEASLSQLFAKLPP